MDDTELIREFIAVENHAGRTILKVQVISWDGPGMPVSTWHVVKTLSGSVSESILEAAIADVLRDSRYFGVCRICKNRNPNGWMDEKTLCQSCNERRAGAVH